MIIWNKLGLINEALTNTGNNIVAVADDGSDEWIAGSAGFDQWIPILLNEHSWNFASQLATLTRTGDSTYPGYSDVFDKPIDAMYISNVWSIEMASFVSPYQGWGMPERDIAPPSLAFSIIGDQIHTSAPAGAMTKYIAFPNSSQAWSVGFVTALRYRVEATLFRSLNEDFAEAVRCDREAEKAIQSAISRTDSEEPRRVMFRSPTVERRRFGRMWMR